MKASANNPINDEVNCKMPWLKYGNLPFGNMAPMKDLRDLCDVTVRESMIVSGMARGLRRRSRIARPGPRCHHHR